jgi:hypothetical protein
MAIKNYPQSFFFKIFRSSKEQSAIDGDSQMDKASTTIQRLRGPGVW